MHAWAFISVIPFEMEMLRGALLTRTIQVFRFTKWLLSRAFGQGGSHSEFIGTGNAVRCRNRPLPFWYESRNTAPPLPRKGAPVAGTFGVLRIRWVASGNPSISICVSEFLRFLEKFVQTIEEHARSSAVDDPVIESEYQVRFGNRDELGFFLGPRGLLFPCADTQNKCFAG